jgi:anti-sigma B factor antagonist
MVTAELVLALHREGRVASLTVAGELDLSTRDALIGAAVNALSPGTVLALDVAAVTFCDSLGVSALVAVRNIANAEGATMVITAAAPQVEQVLRTTGLFEELTRPNGSGGGSGELAERLQGPVGVGVHPDLAADDLDDPPVSTDHKGHALGLRQPEPPLDPELVAYDAVGVG